MWKAMFDYLATLNPIVQNVLAVLVITGIVSLVFGFAYRLIRFGVKVKADIPKLGTAEIDATEENTPTKEEPHADSSK